LGDDIFKIGESEVAPGERKVINLPIARLYTNNWTHMPITVIRGEKDGPKLFICAAQHGDEINGVEIIRRVMDRKELSKIKGILIAVPVVNVFGFLNSSRYLPDRRDLNRSYPGSAKGSLASRLAHLFLTEIAEKSTHGIDIHTGAIHRYNLPQIRTSLDDEQTTEMAKAFGAPVILHSRQRNNSLRETLANEGTPIIVYEAGEALRYNESAIKLGVDGIIRVMRHIGMLRKSRAKRTEPIQTRSSRWVRAKKSGLVQLKAKAGEKVTRHQVIAVIADPLGANMVNLKSPFDGVIIGHTNLPLVHAGDAVINVAKAKISREMQAELEQVT